MFSFGMSMKKTFLLQVKDRRLSCFNYTVQWIIYDGVTCYRVEQYLRQHCLCLSVKNIQTFIWMLKMLMMRLIKLNLLRILTMSSGRLFNLLWDSVSLLIRTKNPIPSGIDVNSLCDRSYNKTEMFFFV